MDFIGFLETTARNRGGGTTDAVRLTKQQHLTNKTWTSDKQPFLHVEGRLPQPIVHNSATKLGFGTTVVANGDVPEGDVGKATWTIKSDGFYYIVVQCSMDAVASVDADATLSIYNNSTSQTIGRTASRYVTSNTREYLNVTGFNYFVENQTFSAYIQHSNASSAARNAGGAVEQDYFKMYVVKVF